MYKEAIIKILNNEITRDGYDHGNEDGPIIIADQILAVIKQRNKELGEEIEEILDKCIGEKKGEYRFTFSLKNEGSNEKRDEIIEALQEIKKIINK